MTIPSLIDIAVRAYTVPYSHPKPEPEAAAETGPRRRRRRRAGLWLPVIFLDTETRVTAALELMVGAYRICMWRGKRLVCLEEGLIHADDLTGEEIEIVKQYWRSQLLDTAADQTDPDSAPALRLRSESDFRKLIHEGTYNRGPGSYMLVGQNIDFDISRFALGWKPSRNKVRGTGRWSRFQGGFSYRLHPGYEIPAAGTKARTIHATCPSICPLQRPSVAGRPSSPTRRSTCASSRSR
jgi:hypothetical protein